MSEVKLKTFELKSNICNYKAIELFDGELIQLLSIDRSGEYKFKSFIISNNDSKLQVDREIYKSISTRTANKLVDFVDTYIYDYLETEYFEGKSYFEIILFYENCKKVYKKCSFLINEFLSRYIRKILKDYSLFLFDGRKNYDHIENLYLKYNRIISTASHDMEGHYRGYQEELLIKRADKSITITRILPNEIRIMQRYELGNELIDFLEFIENYKLLYYYKSDNAEDKKIRHSQNDRRFFSLSIEFKSKKTQLINDDFGKDTLPYYYDIFVVELTKILIKYGIADFLMEKFYNKTYPKADQYVYCSVVFPEGIQRYYYRTSDLSIDVGDLVVVPAGEDNHKTIVEVVKIECFSKDNLPLSLEKTKEIIGKLNKE